MADATFYYTGLFSIVSLLVRYTINLLKILKREPVTRTGYDLLPELSKQAL